MKRRLDELTAADQKKTRELLFAAAEDALKNNATKEFLSGLLTPSEQIMLGRRIWIARLLLENKTYHNIDEQLHVGPNTIMRTELWLQGLLPDYDEILKQVEKEEIAASRRQVAKDRRRAAASNPFGFEALKLKFPLHFLLFPWPKK